MGAIAADEISLARIAAQRLVDPLETPLDVVRHLGCIQAQDLPGAICSIALRTRSRSVQAVVDAFNEGQIVRNWTQRGTLHIVPAVDNDWMLQITGAGMISGSAARLRDLGIDRQRLEQARRIALELVGDGRRITRNELMDSWNSAELLEDVKQRGIHLLSLLCRERTLTLGPITSRPSGKGFEQLLVQSSTWTPQTMEIPLDKALAAWARAFFTGHGPANEADFARWTGLALGKVRDAVNVNRTMQHEGWLMDPGVPERLAEHRAQAEAVMLLPGFDELVLGYKDRTPTVPVQFSQAIVPGNNGMFKATILSKGRVVGTWLPSKGTPTWLVDETPALKAGFERALAEFPR